MGRQSSYLTSFARTHCLRLPPPVEDAWNWQLQGNCLGYPLDVFFPEDTLKSDRRRHEGRARRPWPRVRYDANGVTVESRPAPGSSWIASSCCSTRITSP